MVDPLLIAGLDPLLIGGMLIAAFAGGVLGAAIGALPAFVFTGIMVIAGEAARIVGIISLEEGAELGTTGITAQIAFGVVVSALLHRVILGYDAIGTVRGDGWLDLSPFDREDTYTTEGTQGQPTERLAVEPWLPWFREWGGVGLNGIAFGILGGFTFWATGSPFLTFGISAASLVFLNLGIEEDFGAFQLKIPVTHHITLPASIAPMAYIGIGIAEADPAVVQTELLLLEAVIIGALFGLLGALLGELAERIFYAHGDTHWDPPATSIVTTTFLIALLAIVGVFPTAGTVPVPV